jgi:hypothetical protein
MLSRVGRRHRFVAICQLFPNLNVDFILALAGFQGGFGQRCNSESIPHSCALLMQKVELFGGRVFQDTTRIRCMKLPNFHACRVMKSFLFPERKRETFMCPRVQISSDEIPALSTIELVMGNGRFSTMEMCELSCVKVT